MIVPYGLHVWMELEMTFYSNIARDLSIRVGKFGWGTDGGGENMHDPIMLQQLCSFVHVARGGSSAGAKHDHSGRLRRARHHVDSTTD